MDLNHLYLRVRDLDRSIEFYRRHFGFDGAPEWQGETCLIRNADGFNLALTPDADPPAWPSALHFGFMLDSVDQAKAIHAAVLAAGIPVIESYLEPDFVVFKCLDPDGYVVEIEAGSPTSPPP